MTIRDSLHQLISSNAARTVALVRFAIAFVFVTEGVQKFLYPDVLGVGRFAKIGIPAPEVMAPFVGIVEVVGGLLVLIGFLTRLGAIALVIDMVVAIVSTKIPILIGHGFWGFADPITRTGFWGMAHEARTDIAMLLGCAFLIAVGAGSLSFDYRLSTLALRRARDR
jgi:putative oxidoreductase